MPIHAYQKVVRYNPKAPAAPERPKCGFCGKPLAPTYEDVKVGETTVRVKSTAGEEWDFDRNIDLIEKRWTGGYNDCYDYFCTNSCAAAFGKNAMKLIRDERLILVEKGGAA